MGFHYGIYNYCNVGNITYEASNFRVHIIGIILCKDYIWDEQDEVN